MERDRQKEVDTDRHRKRRKEKRKKNKPFYVWNLLLVRLISKLPVASPSSISNFIYLNSNFKVLRQNCLKFQVFPLEMLKITFLRGKLLLWSEYSVILRVSTFHHLVFMSNQPFNPNHIGVIQGIYCMSKQYWPILFSTLYSNYVKWVTTSWTDGMYSLLVKCSLVYWKGRGQVEQSLCFALLIGYLLIFFC